MAKRKKTKRKKKKKSFKFGGRKKRRAQKTDRTPVLISTLKVIAVICVLAAFAVGFVFLEKYVKNKTEFAQRSAIIELVDVPTWVNESLKQKILDAARAGGEDLTLDEDVAASVQQNIEELIAWLDNITVSTTQDRLLIKANWRKPLATVTKGRKTVYIDKDLIVLDFLPMPSLPIVNVKGLATSTNVPPPGQIWELEDLNAAIQILERLDRMDKLVTPDRLLLLEIDSIDVTNFNGRKNSKNPHILLHAKDQTQIIWGAEIGSWQRHLEAPDEQKLAKLYAYYKEHGSLLGGAKYINLRDPQQSIPRPTDKY